MTEQPHTVWGEHHAVDPEYRARLEAKLQPSKIRFTLAFSALYQVTHELLKSAVVEDLRGFYGCIDAKKKIWLPESGLEDYRSKVLVLDEKQRPFEASLAWYCAADAITKEESGRLDAVYKHRHDLTHELAKYLVDVEAEPDLGLFLAALGTLRKICRHWAEVEMAIGSFDHLGEVDLDSVVSGRVALLELCLSAFENWET